MIEIVANSLKIDDISNYAPRSPSQIASAPACWILLLVSGGRKRPALRQMGTDCECAEVRRESCPVPRGRGKPLPYDSFVFLIDKPRSVRYHLPVRR